MCKVAYKCLNVRERVEVVEWNKKKVPSLPLLSYELSVSVKENPGRKKKKKSSSSWISAVSIEEELSLGKVERKESPLSLNANKQTKKLNKNNNNNKNKYKVAGGPSYRDIVSPSENLG